MSHEPIHSGHFMTSNPHTEPPPDEEDEDVEVDVVEDDDKPEDSGVGGSVDKNAALDEKPVTFYKFGPKKTQSIAIDVSLNKLNKCIKVAYNKMTTPKWKDFKGLRLHWKQRIRLNNVIWRAYDIEFGRNRRKTKPKKTPFCYFAVPDDDTTHAKIEGSVMEGMYWKRRMEAVCAQYKRWRHFTKTKRAHEKPVLKRKRHESEGNCPTSSREEFGEPPPMKLQRSQTPKNTSTEYFDIDDFENVFTDSLFDSLNQPYMFPNPREMMQSGNADIMQPSLLSMQPSLEEIMASLEEDPDSSSVSPNPPPPQSVLQQQLMAPPASSSTISQSSRIAPPPSINNQSLSRPAQDYAVASMLLDYSNQTHCSSTSSGVSASSSSSAAALAAAAQQLAMPTRQSSSITSQMLMLSSQGVQPQYSTAIYEQSTWKPPTTSFMLSEIPSQNSLDYVPQFLQSHAGLLPGGSGQQMTMMTPMRPWWSDSPLAPSSQSPLSAAPSTPATAPSQPLTPAMSLSLAPTTPPNLRSPSTRSNRDATGSFASRLHDVMKSSPSLTHRLEQPSMLVVNKTEDLPAPRFATPVTKDWTSTPSTSLAQFHQQQQQQVHNTRSAPTTAEVRPRDPPMPWKLSSLEPTTPIYPTYSGSLASATQRRSSEERCDLLDMPGSSGMDTKPDFKEEPSQLMSAPPSVKPPQRGASRQVPADSTLHPEERKRILHLHAEQNRRSALKDGFDQLMDMIPDLYSGGVKPTNAVVLAKSAEHIRRLAGNREDQQREKAELQDKIARLNLRISALQANLPSSSSSISSSSGPSSKLDPKLAMEAFVDRYTREKSKKDWRFWLMSRMLQPLTVCQPTSFAASLPPADACSREELAASCSDWLQKHWRGPELRPLASTLLVNLATNSNVLTNPESLEDYVKDQLKNPV